MISEEPPVDYWIDETPPREGDVERVSMIFDPGAVFLTYQQAFQYVASLFDSTTEKVAAIFVDERATLLRLYENTASPTPAPSDPTKKSYPTSVQINKSRRTRRR